MSFTAVPTLLTAVFLRCIVQSTTLLLVLLTNPTETPVLQLRQTKQKEEVMSSREGKGLIIAFLRTPVIMPACLFTEKERDSNSQKN